MIGQRADVRLGAAMVLVGLLATAAAALGIGVPALDGGPGADAAVDEPQYILTALSLAEDGDLDISDELADDRAANYHPATLPVQTQVQPDGAQVSPHDPLLAVLLTPAVALGGWVGAKLVLSAIAGVLAALLVWVAVRRFAVALPVAGVVVAAAAASAPLGVYGQQVYPELPAALVVTAAVAVLAGHPGRGGVAALVLAAAALPWLSVKYAPVAAVLVLLGLVPLWRAGRRRLVAAAVAALGLAGVAFLVLHRALYGGWTAYAAGDHFQASGELGVVGLSPDYAGRSTRLLGLLVDRDFGLVAWQPAWLLVVPAMAALPWLLPRTVNGWPVIVAPVLTGWLVATFVALTMHGYWWPGRQVVIILPLAVLAVAVWLDRVHRAGPPVLRHLVLGGSAVLATAGATIFVWVLVAGWSGRLSWVGAPDEPVVPAALATVRRGLPDYRVLDGPTWWLHVAWLLAFLALGALGVRTAKRTDLPSDLPTTRTGSRRLQPAGTHI